MGIKAECARLYGTVRIYLVLDTKQFAAAAATAAKSARHGASPLVRAPSGPLTLEPQFNGHSTNPTRKTQEGKKNSQRNLPPPNPSLPLSPSLPPDLTLKYHHSVPLPRPFSQSFRLHTYTNVLPHRSPLLAPLAAHRRHTCPLSSSTIRTAPISKHRGPAYLCGVYAEYISAIVE